MSGLLISLKPNEKFLVNGALLSNGPRRGQICIVGDSVNVLRLSDVIHPRDVRTPVTRLYHALQTLMSGDASADEAYAEIEQRYHALAFVFDGTEHAKLLNGSRTNWADGRLYSALYRLKPLIEIEAALLAALESQAQPKPVSEPQLQPEAEVA